MASLYRAQNSHNSTQTKTQTSQSTGEIVKSRQKPQETGKTVWKLVNTVETITKNMPSPALTFEETLLKTSCVSTSPSAPNEPVQKRPQVGL